MLFLRAKIKVSRAFPTSPEKGCGSGRGRKEAKRRKRSRDERAAGGGGSRGRGKNKRATGALGGGGDSGGGGEGTAKRIVAMSAKKEKEQFAMVRDDDGVAKRNVREKEGSALGRNWDSTGREIPKIYSSNGSNNFAFN